MDLCQTKKKCSLCELEIIQNSIVDGDDIFCCHGCHAVYTILKAKNELEGYKEHPLFNQAITSNLISNPALIIPQKTIPEEVEKIYLEIGNLWCPSCAELIHLVLMREKGVVSCFVDYATDLASIEFSPRYISKEQIFKLIASFGYEPREAEDAEDKPVSHKLYLRFVIAAFCSLNVMMFSYPLYASYFDYDPMQYGALFAWLSFLMTLPVVTYSFWPIFHKFWNSLKFGFYGMETLVFLGVASSFTLSFYELVRGGTKVYFDSLTVIVAFVLLGKIIEAKAKFSAKNSLLRLNLTVPRRARKQCQDGSLHFVPIKEIKVSDVYAVFQGEKIAIDGVVVKGSGYCNESLMTGEAMPIFKEIDSKVIGGSILQTGRLYISAEAMGGESQLGRIIRMIKEGIKYKTPQKRVVDKIVAWFVPVILLIFSFKFAISLLFDNAETAFTDALSILLISCPCAIGIAAPLAESKLMSALCELGAIVRNRAVLPVLGKETVFVFDKTGTITEGKFRVLKGLDELENQELQVIKAMTSESLHLISLSISKSIEGEIFKLDGLEEIAGKGLKGIYQGHIYLLGSYEFLKLEGVLNINSLAEENKYSTKVYFAVNGKLKTTILLGDQIRDGAIELIASLKPARTILLSGDAEEAVLKVAKTCFICEHYSAKSPLEKKELIEALKDQGNIVFMMGDGINDAPALTVADVAVSVVNATDISIQVSDILLTSDRLLSILKVRKLAKFGQTILKQNLFWAFFYNIVGVILAFFGVLSPIFATFAMMTSSLIVLYNAKRL